MQDLYGYKQEFLWSSYTSRYKEDKRAICKNDVAGLLKWYFRTEEQPDSNSSETIRLCANRAYGDLCRNLRGIAVEPQKEIWKEEIVSKIVQWVNRIDCYPDFDTWHQSTCDDIIAYAYDIFPITYGIAQKWVNMTLKYLLICGYDFREKEKYLHVPIDSYIYKAFACKQSENKYALFYQKAPVFHEGEGPGNLDYYKEDGNNRTQPWSKLNRSDYISLQIAIREAVASLYASPIEWEGPAWIAQAKIEKAKRNKKRK